MPYTISDRKRFQASTKNEKEAELRSGPCLLRSMLCDLVLHRRTPPRRRCSHTQRSTWGTFLPPYIERGLSGHPDQVEKLWKSGERRFSNFPRHQIDTSSGSNRKSVKRPQVATDAGSGSWGGGHSKYHWIDKKKKIFRFSHFEVLYIYIKEGLLALY